MQRFFDRYNQRMHIIGAVLSQSIGEVHWRTLNALPAADFYILAVRSRYRCGA